MRTALVVLCPSCDVRLPLVAKRCPACAARTVPAQGAKPRRRGRVTDRAGRWVRWGMLVVVGLSGLGLVLAVPAALVGALFSPHPVATVLAVTVSVGTLAFFFGVFSFLLWLVTLFVGLALTPFALLAGGGVRPTRWASPRAEPVVGRRPLAHRVVMVAEWLRDVLRPSSPRFGRWLVRFLALAGIALAVAVPVQWLRGIPLGSWDDAVSAGMALACAFVMSGFGFIVLAALVSPIAEWIVAAPGLHVPALERPEDACAVLRESRRGTRIEGIVRGSVEPFASPLSGRPCVAARVRGVVGDACIDDAFVAPFVVETAEGLVRVEGRDVLVAFEPENADGEDGETFAASGLWLAERGIEQRPGARVAEALVRSGDRVVVWGRGEEALRDGGYRGGHEPRVVRIDDGAGPVLVEPSES